MPPYRRLPLFAVLVALITGACGGDEPTALETFSPYAYNSSARKTLFFRHQSEGVQVDIFLLPHNGLLSDGGSAGGLVVNGEPTNVGLFGLNYELGFMRPGSGLSSAVMRGRVSDPALDLPRGARALDLTDAGYLVHNPADKAQPFFFLPHTESLLGVRIDYTLTVEDDGTALGSLTRRFPRQQK